MSESEKKTVMVVDDYDENRASIVQMLDDLDISIVGSNSGKEALERMKEQPPAVVLLDADMPEMDGYQVLNQMFSDQTIRHIPVILLTTNLSDRKQMLHKPLLDVVDYMTKPINKSALLTKVKTYLELDRYRDAIKTLHDENEKLLEAMHEGILGLDKEGRIKFANTAAVHMLRANLTQLMDTYVVSIFEEPNHNAEPNWHDHPIQRVCEEGNILQVEKTEFWRTDGTAMRVKFAAVPVQDLDGMHIVLAFKMLAHERSSENKINQLSNIDQLTGLPNRSRFEEKVEEAVKRAKRGSGHVAVLFIDLDHFKNINESLGHDIGDDMIKGVAERLSNFLRRSDTVSRVGGDEFAVLLEGIDDPKNAGSAAQKMMDQVHQPFLIDGHEIFTGCSIGIATYPSCGDSAKTLIKNADIAAYRAKSLGRNNYQYFNFDLNKEIVLRMEMENDLRNALQSNQMVLDFSPVISLKTNSIAGFEVQLFWQHPRMGRMAENEFRKIAEDCGLIGSISEWVIKTTCERAGKLFAVQPDAGDLVICLDVSPHFIAQDGFANLLHESLLKHNLQGSQIMIEMCEAVVLNRQQSYLDVLTDLHTMDVKLAIADFGMGFAPFQHLRNAPLDVIKLGTELISQIVTNPQDQIIVQHLIAMVKALGKEIWVDGVDSEEKVQLLKSYGAHWMQGSIVTGAVAPSNVVNAVDQIKDS